MKILFFITAFYAIHTIIMVVRRSPRNVELPFLERKVEMTHRYILCVAGAAMLVAGSPLAVFVAISTVVVLIISISVKKKLFGKILSTLLTRRSA